MTNSQPAGIFTRRIAFIDAIDKALEQADLTAFARFRIRAALTVRPRLIDHLQSLLVELAAEDSVAVDVGPYIDLDKLEQFIQLVIKYLPQILEILLPLFGLSITDLI